MLVLGIETSCDETGLALFDSDKGLQGHILHSQAALHAQYGGVVPELACRDHIKNILPLLSQLLQTQRIDKQAIDAIAYTSGPGLTGALLTGAAVAHSLSWSLAIPCIAVHHMEGHLLAPMLETPAPTFPFLALLVSGGHTLLVHVKGIGEYTTLGESLDDAAGEAFDKTAKLLGLGYPGGPALAKLAEHGSAKKYPFPRPMLNRPELNFSFSGLKTAVLTQTRKIAHLDSERPHLAASFQAAVVDVLSTKTQHALKKTGLKTLVIAGGVSANQALRERMLTIGQTLGVRIHYPRIEFCTDNGAMIAYAGCQRLLAGERSGLNIKAHARWDLQTLTPPGSRPERSHARC